MNEGTQGEDSPQKRHEGPAGFEGLRSLVTDLNVQRSERTGDQASPGKGALADHDTEEEVRSRRENTGPVAQRRPTAAKRALGGQNVVRPKRWDERTGQGGVERTQPAAKMPEPRAKHEVDEPRRHPISGIPIERRSRDTLTPKLVGTALAIAAVMGIAIHFWLSEEEIAFEEPPAGGGSGAHAATASLVRAREDDPGLPHEGPAAKRRVRRDRGPVRPALRRETVPARPP